jgi:hypothetical protein
MKDRLGEHKFDNLPIKNPTQNAYVRAVKMPGSGLSGLEDRLAGLKKKWKDYEDLAMRNRMEEL